SEAAGPLEGRGGRSGPAGSRSRWAGVCCGGYPPGDGGPTRILAEGRGTDGQGAGPAPPNRLVTGGSPVAHPPRNVRDAFPAGPSRHPGEPSQREAWRMRIRLLVVDDFPMMRLGLACALRDDPDIEIVADSGSALEA